MAPSMGLQSAALPSTAIMALLVMTAQKRGPVRQVTLQVQA